jgi:hypothetical protein
VKRRHWHPPRCRICDRHGDDVGGISQTGLCPDCSHDRFLANLDDLHTRSGPGYEHWARRMLLAAHARLVDVERASALDARDVEA